MNRADFLAAVHELAEKLGRAVYGLVAAESERVRAAALEVATAQLRSVVGLTPEPAAVAVAVVGRAPRRCSVCKETGHTSRRCGARDAGPSEPEPVAPVAPDVVPVPPPLAPAPLAEPEPADDDEDDDAADAAPPIPPPLHGRTASRGSKPPHSAAARKEPDMPAPKRHRVLTPPKVNTWPPGLTHEMDRRDEISDMNVIAILHRAGRHQHG